jgi:hypothetical protein
MNGAVGISLSSLRKTWSSDRHQDSDDTPHTDALVKIKRELIDGFDAKRVGASQNDPRE